MLETHIDRVALEELMNVMEDDFPVLVNAYLSDAKIRLESLQQALNNQKPDELRQAAHSLKGSSSNLGAIGLADLLGHMEEYGRENKMNEAYSLMPRIHNEYVHVQTIMKTFIDSGHNF